MLSDDELRVKAELDQILSCIRTKAAHRAAAQAAVPGPLGRDQATSCTLTVVALAHWSTGKAGAIRDLRPFDPRDQEPRNLVPGYNWHLCTEDSEEKWRQVAEDAKTRSILLAVHTPEHKFAYLLGGEDAVLLHSNQLVEVDNEEGTAWAPTFTLHEYLRGDGVPRPPRRVPIGALGRMLGELREAVMGGDADRHKSVVGRAVGIRFKAGHADEYWCCRIDVDASQLQ